MPLICKAFFTDQTSLKKVERTNALAYFRPDVFLEIEVPAESFVADGATISGIKLFFLTL